MIMTESYTFLHISDIQYFPLTYPDSLTSIFTYLESVKDWYNIKAIILTGDFVDDNTSIDSWERYITASNLTTIPIYEIVGNHDAYDNGDPETPNYENYYNYIGSDKVNWTTTIGNFQFLGLDFGEPALSSDKITEYRAYLNSDPNKLSLICTHWYLYGNGEYTSLASSIQNNLIVKPTIILCGHNGGYIAEQIFNAETYNGYDCFEYMTNYQKEGNYLAGKLFTVTTANNQILKITHRDFIIYPSHSLGSETTIYEKTVNIHSNITSTRFNNQSIKHTFKNRVELT